MKTFVYNFRKIKDNENFYAVSFFNAKKPLMTFNIIKFDTLKVEFEADAEKGKFWVVADSPLKIILYDLENFYSCEKTSSLLRATHYIEF